jgi:hypothetical protein
MPKHKPEEIKLGDLIDAMRDNPQSWWHIMGVEIPGLAEAWQEALCYEDLDHLDLLIAKAQQIEGVYINKHKDDVYLVSWPEHVSDPRYNGDASYQLIREGVESE